MQPMVLVHGAWHGGWCWEQLVPLLEQAGLTVYAPDLAGHGPKPMAANRVSLKRYVDSLAALLGEIGEPVTLVGHSMGGIVISRLAEQIPEQIHKLIYLAAFLPQNGEMLAEINHNDGSLLNQFKTIDREQMVLKIAPGAARQVFYHDCDSSVADRAVARLIDQPLAPLNTPVELTEQRFGTVRRSAILCANDLAITPDLQRELFRRGQCEPVLELQAGHSPFYSMPEELTAAILELAGSPSSTGTY